MQPLRVGNTALAQRYRRFLLQSRNFSTVPFDATIAERAADLRARYNVRIPDAMQLATAIHAGCQAFLTNDQRLQRVSDTRVLVLGELSL